MSSIKKTVSIVLAILMLASVFCVAPVSVFAAGSVVTGTVCNCKYEYDTDAQSLRIYGGTTVESDKSGDLPWNNSSSDDYKRIKTVTIDEGVNNIGSSVFKEFKSLTKVSLPSTLLTLGTFSFYSCYSLKYITLPSKLVKIDARAFGNCGDLRQINIPKSVKNIESGAFAGCNALTMAYIADGINAEIGAEVFLGSGLKSVYIPEGVKKIGEHAFGYTYSSSKYYRVDGFKIITVKGSVADAYADTNGFSVERVTLIPTVEITDIDTPIVDKNPDMTLNSPQKSLFSSSVFWLNVTTDQNVSAEDFFEEGNNYSVTFVLTAKSGYRFVQDGVDPCFNATINGEAVKAKNNSFDPGEVASVAYEFPRVSAKYINTVVFQGVETPQIGKHPDFDFATTSKGFTAKDNSVLWYNETDKKYLKKTDTFIANKQYSARFDLTADDGYRFTVKDGAPTVKASVNRINADVRAFQGKNPARNILVVYTYPMLTANKVVSHIDLMDLVEPAVGESPSFDLPVSLSSGATVYKIEWKESYDYVEATDTFDYGKTYSVIVYLEINSGFEFASNDGKTPAVTATVNGKDAEVFNASFSGLYKLGVKMEYTTPKLIENVEITDIVEPVAGENPRYTATASENAKVVEVMWEGSDGLMTESDVFEEDEDYICVVIVCGVSGFVVDADKTSVSIGGSSVNPSYFGENAMEINCLFTAKPAPTEPTEETQPDTDEPTEETQPDTDEPTEETQPDTDEPTEETQPDTIEPQNINEIYIDDVVEPVDGKHPVFTVSAHPHVKVTKVEWFNNYEDMPIEESDIFAVGSEYEIRVSLETDEGFVFDSSVPVTINGAPVSIESSTENTLTAYTYFYAVPEQSETEETYEPTDPHSMTQTFYYLPSAEQEAKNCRYAIRVVLPELEHDDMILDMIPSGKQVDGVNVYKTEVYSHDEVLNVEFRVYDGETLFNALAFPGELVQDRIVTSEGSAIDLENATAEPSTIAPRPTEPGYTEPSTKVTEPSETQPVTGRPTEPGYTYPPTKPTEPGYTYPPTKPTEPGYTETPTNPTESSDTQPATKPTEPGYTEPAETQNSTDKPTEPSVTEPQPTAPVVTKKADNPIKVTAKTKSVKLKKLKKKAQKVKSLTIKKAQGKVSIKIITAKKSIKKYLKFNSKGTLTIKRWKKAKKGTYKLTVLITAKGNSKYTSKSIVKNLKIKLR